MICEPDSQEDGNDDFGGDPKAKLKIKGHGGCGNIQPSIRRDALRLIGVWKPAKSEDDEGEWSDDEAT